MRACRASSPRPSPRIFFAALVALASPGVAQGVGERPDPSSLRYLSPAEYLGAMSAGVAEGRIADPRERALPVIPEVSYQLHGASPPCISSASIHLFEDSDQLLLTDFSDCELIDLMVEAANDLMATRGDVFDFVGFWIDFTAHHEIGAAFYLPIENTVSGIGDPSLGGTPLFNSRDDLGLAGDNVEGFVMMWDVNHSYWSPGTSSAADFTRLALAQEFEHRWGMFLPDLIDGRQLQGDNGSCGRGAHWNWRVDGQGSGMEISEWVGSNPASLVGSFVTFNTDIPGGVFSYSDLYLMGYVSPAEMDAGNSELRYMDNSDCSSSYNGPISSFSSADIVTVAGTRVPDASASQKHFRTGWIMIHLPGQPPTTSELDKAVGILEQHMEDWNYGTLARGTMNDTLFDECHAVIPYGSANPTGSLTMQGGRPAIGTTMVLGVENPLGTQPAGSRTFLIYATQPDPAFPNGLVLPGFGMSGPGATGELLISIVAPNPAGGVLGPLLPAAGPALVPLPIVPSTSLLGVSIYLQGLIADPTVALGVRLGLTNGIEIVIGP